MAARSINGKKELEATIAKLAGRQHSVVSRTQLLAAGLAPSAVERRVRLGVLQPIYRGVYQCGPLAAKRAKEMAACLACGRAAYLGGESATALWVLAPPPSAPAIPEVLVTHGQHRIPGIGIRHVRTLRPDEVTTLESIPITTAARTLIDLAGSARHTSQRSRARALGCRRNFANDPLRGISVVRADGVSDQRPRQPVIQRNAVNECGICC